MPINPDAVGSESEPGEHSWTSKDCLLYAVGVGAGTEELAFTTENSQNVTHQVLPTFAVIVGMAATSSGGAFTRIGSFNPAMLVHGEQGIFLEGPIPTEGTVRTVTSITGIYDKGSAAVVALESRSVDAATGRPLFRNTSSLFIRGEGGFGGDRGPSGPRAAIPERPPDETVTYRTSPDQALVYRLSGDRNPLHSDPTFAAMAGFDRPILHGLCTYGFTGRALLHALCGSDPARFGSMEGRFSKPTYPGDELTVSMWRDGDGALFRTETQRGEVVIDGGRFTFRT
ncbi:MAG TPA: MaoC/PaaZ C-terminal domain-containing protein [Acidimicrobiales bacterium]|nr:MaoC/PaaZ C-terminal domain-containing protein [Acidimicrobiales bacterium]